jgi:hypothetical protein
MNVLIMGETSGRSRMAFRRRGHNVWSCDLLPADDGDSAHLQCDVRHVFHSFRPHFFDLMVAHPDCTYLTSSGLHWNLRNPERAKKTEDALTFVRWLMQCPVERWALENPRGCIGTQIRPADQYIQPYQFGDDASKNTGLWLHNLPKLVIDSALRVPGRQVLWNGKWVERWANQNDDGQNNIPERKGRWKERSETYLGIAEAFARNWG